jgi:hypothetical protein
VHPPTTAPSPPRRSARLALAVALGVCSAVYVVAFAWANPDFTSDFDQVWGAARALVAGDNPYDAVGPGRQYPWRWPLYYPLPAVILTTPLAALPVVAARAVFSGVSAALLAWAITRDGFARWPLLLSISFVTAIELSQWSPLLTAAMLMPSLGWLAVTKPNLGAAMAAHAESNRALLMLVGGSLLLVAASFAVQPGWVADWLDKVRSAPHFKAPVVRPFGFALLLALLRWRRPEARLLAALALVPQTPTFYDHVFVFTVARTFRESLALTVCTFAVFFVIGFNAPLPSFDAWGDLLARATVYLIYLPALVMVLRRPNTGDVPELVSRFEQLVRAGTTRALAGFRR